MIHERDLAAINEDWPQLSALVRVLQNLDGATVPVVGVVDERAMAEAVARQFNRAGGPTLTARAFE